MARWPDNRIQELLGIELPIIQAPMAGANLSAMAVAVSEAGALGSLPCAMLSADQMRAELETFRHETSRPINVNFFCHQPSAADPQREQAWKQHLAKYYIELGLDPQAPLPTANRRPFDDAACDLVVELKPEVVSFHFGLPNQELLSRVRASGAKILSSATTVDEARWLERAGCDAIIAQGYEAGGHRGMFLTDDVSTQAATLALVPQMVDAVQLGTAYLLCPEATLSAVHRQAIKNLKDNGTAITNVFSGRPARGIVNRLIREVGPLSPLAPSFPLAGSAIAPLRKQSEAAGSEDFAQMWSGQSGRLCRELPAGELTRQLAAETLSIMNG